MNTQDRIRSMKHSFRHSYNYLSQAEIEELYNRAFNFYIHLAFPLRHDIVELPDDRVGDISIIREMMVDILERSGASNLTAYSENGLSFEFDGSMFNDKFAQMIIPIGKVYKRR